MQGGHPGIQLYAEVEAAAALRECSVQLNTAHVQEAAQRRRAHRQAVVGIVHPHAALQAFLA